jgi:hypothetical protein
MILLDATKSTNLKAMESGDVIYIKERNQHFLKRHHMIGNGGKPSISVYDVFDNEKFVVNALHTHIQ